MFCTNCGQEIGNVSACPTCGAVQDAAAGQPVQQAYQQPEQQQYQQPYQQQPYQQQPQQPPYGVEQKSKLVAGLLQIFLPYGIGRFYLGYTSTGVAQLLLVFACGAGSIWSLIDGIMILTGSVKTDARGVPLKD